MGISDIQALLAVKTLKLSFVEKISVSMLQYFVHFQLDNLSGANGGHASADSSSCAPSTRTPTASLPSGPTTGASLASKRGFCRL